MLPRMSEMKIGDVIIGLPSSGLHSNGFSLVRKCVEISGLQYSDPAPFQSTASCTTSTTQLSLGEALLTPTRIYVKELLPLIRRRFIKAIAHITGGGLVDNIPRVLPAHLKAVLYVDNVVDCTANVDRSTFNSSSYSGNGWTLAPVFRWLQSVGNLSQEEMLRTFNCGIGMVLIVDRIAAPLIMQELFQPALSNAATTPMSNYHQPIMLGTICSRDATVTQVEIQGSLL